MKRLSRFFICLFILFCCAATLFAADNRYALVIGNSNYRDKSISALVNPVNDATDMAAVLRELGYNVTLKTNTGLRDMMDAIQDFSLNLGRSSETEGFFWFAGHGLSVRGIHYLLPVDVDPVSDNIIARGSYSVDDLMEEIGNARNRTNLVVIDACRNSLLPGGNRSVGSRGLAVLAADDYRVSGNKIVYSTMAGKTASDGVPGSRNSPFAQAFMANIRKTESFDDVFLDIANETVRLTRGDQQPYAMGSFAVKSYMLNSQGAPVTAQTAQAAPQPSTQPARVSPSAPKEQKSKSAPTDFTLDGYKVMSLYAAPLLGSPKMGENGGDGGQIQGGGANFGGSLLFSFYEKYRNYGTGFFLPNSFYFSATVIGGKAHKITVSEEIGKFNMYGSLGDDHIGSKVKFTNTIFSLGSSWKIRTGSSQRFITKFGLSLDLFLAAGNIDQRGYETFIWIGTQSEPTRFTHVFLKEKYDPGEGDNKYHGSASESVVLVMPGFGLHAGFGFRLTSRISLDLAVNYKMPFYIPSNICIQMDKSAWVSGDGYQYSYLDKVIPDFKQLSGSLGITVWWPR